MKQHVLLLMAVQLIACSCQRDQSRIERSPVWITPQEIEDRIEEIEQMRSLSTHYPDQFDSAHEVLELYDSEVVAGPVVGRDSTLSLTERKMARLAHLDVQSRRLLNYSAPSIAFPVIQSRIGETMLHQTWMLAGHSAPDSLLEYYLSNAIDAYCLDFRMIISSLDRRADSSRTQLELSKQALLNLSAWHVILRDWVDENPEDANQPFQLKYDRASANDFLDQFEDRRATLESRLASLND